MKTLRKKSRAGYTALELLVVIAIVSMVFTSALVYFHPFMKTAKTKTAATDMAGYMRVARTAAVTRRTYCTFQVITNPHDSGFLGKTPRELWEDDFSDVFKEVKPPANSVVAYFSDKDGIPVNSPPEGEDSIFALYFQELPANMMWTNYVSSTDDDPTNEDLTSEEPINGLRIVFNNRGAIEKILPDPTTALQHNTIKAVERTTSEEALGTQVVRYMILVQGTGAVRIMSHQEFEDYWHEEVEDT